MIKFICVLITSMIFLSANAQKQKEDTELPQELEELSGAEIIMRLQKFIATDQQRLIQLNNRSTQLSKDIERLTQQFNKLDSEHQKVMEPNAFSSKTKDKDIEQRWEYVRTTLDLLLRRRQAVQQQISIIENKVEKQKEVVDFITLGQIPVSDETVELPLPPAHLEKDTTTQEQSATEIKHRKELNAIEDLERLEAELRLAKHSLLLVEQLIRLNREDLELSNVISETSEKQLSLYEERIAAFEEVKNGTYHLDELKNAIAEDTARISALQARITNLENIYSPVADAVNTSEKKVESAREYLEFLQSPLAPHRISYWLKYNLPRIGIIIGILLLIWIVMRWAIRLILNKLKKRRIAEERVERIETLKLASSSIITILLVFIGILVLLSELGVDITVVLGGAAVFSLVIAFGTQSLVKDYFSGFTILLENQYRVGNVVRINQTTGIVENMSLRLTLLRDLEGVAHFIPHGQINEVSNLTHGWSQIALEVRISYNEDVDHVMKVLTGLAAQMKDDPEYGSLIVRDPEMLGVDAFTESALIIKLLIKTKPLKQWVVKRELLRRIKNHFDELGIKIPYPHLSVNHHNAYFSGDGGRKEGKVD